MTSCQHRMLPRELLGPGRRQSGRHSECAPIINICYICAHKLECQLVWGRVSNLDFSVDFAPKEPMLLTGQNYLDRASINE